MPTFDRLNIFSGESLGVQWGYLNTSTEFSDALDAWFTDFFAGDANLTYQAIRIPGVRCTADYCLATMGRDANARSDRGGDANVLPSPSAVYFENWELPARTDLDSFVWTNIIRHNRQGFKDMIDTATGNTGMLDPMDKCQVDIKIKDHENQEPRRTVMIKNEGQGIDVAVEVDYYYDLNSSNKIKFPGVAGNFADATGDWNALWNSRGYHYSTRTVGCFHRLTGDKDKATIDVKLKGQQIALPGDGPGGSSTNTFGFDTIFDGSVDPKQPFVLEFWDRYSERQYENDGVFTVQGTP